MSTVAVAAGYIPGSAMVSWAVEQGCFMAFTQRLDGQWDARPAPILEADDGSTVCYVGNDNLQQAWRWVTVTAAPVRDPEPEPGLLASLMYSNNPGMAKVAQKTGNFIKNPKNIVTAACYREPVHGKWYQSAWMWFFWFLTALCAFIWFVPMDVPSQMSHNGTLEELVALFGWMFIGWMFLAASAIGALQKSGYKRLAAIYSLALWAVINVFWESQMKNSKSRQ